MIESSRISLIISIFSRCRTLPHGGRTPSLPWRIMLCDNGCVSVTMPSTLPNARLSSFPQVQMTTPVPS